MTKKSLKLQPFEQLSVETLLDTEFCPVERHRVRLPNGTEKDWYVKPYRDAVIVVPVTEDGQVILEHAYKYGVDAEIVEFCAGVIDEGELPLDAAKRELGEETGYMAMSWTSLGTVCSSPTSSPMKYHFFLAEGAMQVSPQDLEPEEQIEVMVLPSWEAAVELLHDSDTLTTSASLAAIEKVNEFLRSQEE